jgi:voltage-gated potassium channel
MERTLAVMSDEPRPQVRNPSWELFVLALTTVSLVNIVLVVLPLDDESRNVVLVVDATLCVVFLSDFLYRLRAAESKRAYMRKSGLLDLLGSLPLPGFRLARVPRLVQSVIVIRRHGGRRLWVDFLRERAQGAMYVVLLLVVLVLEFASIGILAAERGAGDENIRTASDALWWGYVTITTVGYGDHFPVTNEGRIVGVVLLTIGVGLFGTFTAFIANVFLSPRRRRVSSEPEDTFAELRSLLDEHERTAARLRGKLDELERGARRGSSQPAPP